MKRRLLHSVRFPAAVLALATALAGCVVGPDYKKPAVVTPPDWNWKVAEPGDERIKGDWWRLFNDPELNRLEAEANQANQELQVAVAHVDQSRAVARVAKSKFFPQITLDPSVTRFHTQLNHVPSDLTATAYTVPLDLSYEVDLWGKIRRGFEAARAGAEANVADYYSVRLKLHGDVATDYFLLRRLDTEISLLQQTIGLRADSVKIIQERFESGLASEMDLELARTQLAQTQTSLLEMRRQRDDLQNALALLCGRPAAAFEIPPAPLADVAPQIPVGLPSALLERRPDVAAAERRMAAANAQIGVAKAAFFPALTLTGEAGYSSFHAATLLDWESQLFQFGPAVTVPILNGGRLRSGLKAARADYQAACAAYQQQVLAAFKDVSDALVDVDSYSQQLATETNAVNAADEAARLSRERQQQGLINYLEVLEAERSQLQAQSQMIQLRALRLVSTVHLIKALGGGFDATAVTANPRPPADAASKGS